MEQTQKLAIFVLTWSIFAGPVLVTFVNENTLVP